MPQVPVPLVWYHHHKLELARVHAGFLLLFGLLADQVLAAAKNFNPSLPLRDGPQPGAALAVLASPTVNLLTSNKDVRMYNLAGRASVTRRSQGPTASSSRRATASSI
jgi:hypothetical protein